MTESSHAATADLPRDVVDAHAHAYAIRPPQWTGWRGKHVPTATAEQFLATMDAHGVRRAVAVATRTDGGRDYVTECVQSYPDRFRAIGVYDPRLGHRQVTAAAADGLSGLRVFGAYGDDPNGDESELRRTLRSLADHELVLWLFPRQAELPLWERVLADQPDLVVVLNHLGYCSDFDSGGGRVYDERVWRLADRDGVYATLSGQYDFSIEPYPHFDLRRRSEEVYRRLGAERMMWASNYPLVLAEPDGYARALTVVAAHLPDLTEAERAAIFSGTALRVLGWT